MGVVLLADGADGCDDETDARRRASWCRGDEVTSQTVVEACDAEVVTAWPTAGHLETRELGRSKGGRGDQNTMSSA